VDSRWLATARRPRGCSARPAATLSPPRARMRKVADAQARVGSRRISKAVAGAGDRWRVLLSASSWRCDRPGDKIVAPCMEASIGAESPAPLSARSHIKRGAAFGSLSGVSYARGRAEASRDALRWSVVRLADGPPSVTSFCGDCGQASPRVPSSRRPTHGLPQPRPRWTNRSQSCSSNWWSVV
jgi:hypothetical protein